MKKIFKLAVTVAAAMSMLTVLGCRQSKEKGAFTVEKGKFKVAMEIGYPPFESYAEDGVTPVGFDIELGKALAKEFKLDVEFIDTAWDGILAGLDTERYDAVISAMTITDERKKNYDFSKPYIGNAQAVIVNKDSNLKVSKIADLEGKKVGYQAETTSDFFMEKSAAAGKWTFEPNEYDKVLNAFDDLRYRRIDAVVVDLLVADEFLGEENSPFVCAWQGDSEEYFGICVKKGNKELLKNIDAALMNMEYNGSLQKIYDRTFSMDFSSTISSQIAHAKRVGKTKQILSWIPQLLNGAKITILLTLASVVAGIILGILLAVGKMSKHKIWRWLSTAYTFFFRGTPLLMQLYFVYYGLPLISPSLTINSKFLAAFIAFALNSGAYCCEIIRGGIESIDKGQFEASKVLGMNYFQTMSLVILPQSIKRLIPPVGNEFIMMLKDCSLVSIIALADITKVTRSIQSSTASSLVFIPAMILYLIITGIFTLIFRWLEKKNSVYE